MTNKELERFLSLSDDECEEAYLLLSENDRRESDKIMKEQIEFYKKETYKSLAKGEKLEKEKEKLEQEYRHLKSLN